MTDARLTRCSWPGDNPLYVAYHDHEWGVPVRDDRELFEHLILDGFQAGLSWITILKKRENFRRAFEGFEPERIARWGPERIDALLGDAGIVRNRAKIQAAIGSANGWLRIQAEHGSFSTFLWSFVGDATRVNSPRTPRDVPAESPESRAMSRALKAYGFGFGGPTICYAFMQAVGMVDDHLVDCFRYEAR